MGCFSGSESKSQSQSKSAAQEAGLKKALDVYLPELGKGANIFSGERVAPFSTLQQTALSGIGNYADLFSTPQTVGAAPLFQETGTALKGFLSGETGAAPMTATDTAAYFDRAIKDPTMKGFREDVIPGIQEAFAGPGFYGSARSHELSKASQDVSELLGSQRAALEWDVLGRNQQLEEAKAGRGLTAIPQAMDYGRIPAQGVKDNLEIAARQVGGLSEIFGFGQAEQTQEQRVLQNEIMKFAERNAITDPENLAIILSLLSMNYGAASSRSSGPGLGYSAISSFAGGFGGGLGAGMATPSK